MTNRCGTALIVLVLGMLASPAAALPVLQLDIAGGVYDPVTKTIVATSDRFVLSAVLTFTPDTTPDRVVANLAEQYYISMALIPMTGPAHNNSLGTLSVNSTAIPVTAGMTYGVPPMERLASLQGWDPGDFSNPQIYPTFFYQHAFHFDPNARAVTYDSAVTPGGLTPSASGGSYYYSLTVDTTLLDPAYQLHFDLYDSYVVNCGNGCKDVDIEHYAPSTHDARSQIPEPSRSSYLLLGLLSTVAVVAIRKRVTS